MHALEFNEARKVALERRGPRVSPISKLNPQESIRILESIRMGFLKPSWCPLRDPFRAGLNAVLHAITASNPSVIFIPSRATYFKQSVLGGTFVN